MKKSRAQYLALNTISSLLGQTITVICGFVLTKIILEHFGSEVNGIVASITQFLGFISFMELGVGAVVKSAMYEPLAKSNWGELSRVIKSSDSFFRKIAIALIFYTIVLCVLFPVISNSSFSWFYSATLVIAIAVSIFAQYYFGMTYQLLLNADQKTYIPTVVCAITIIINTVVSYILVKCDASIQTVKLATSIVYILRPLVYNIYVKRNYHIDKSIVLKDEPLKQKWNGFTQHLAYIVANYTGVFSLTIFSTLANVSIYTVYHSVVIGVQQVISCISVGFSAMLGNVIYSEDVKTMKETFSWVEWFFHFVTSIIFAITGVLILPFVDIYTRNVVDANYHLPVFAMLLTISQFLFSIRIPYQTLVYSANHFKQTQNSAIIEMCINLILSIILVLRFGLIGVALGMIAALIYRILFYISYLRKNIINYDVKIFIRLFTIDVLIVTLTMFFGRVVLYFMQADSLSYLALCGVIVSLITISISSCLNYLLYPSHVLRTIRYIKNTIRHE